VIYRAEQVSACFADGSCLTVVSDEDEIDYNHLPAAMPRGVRKNMWVLGALIALGAVIFLARLHTYNEPLERDITTYAVIAHELLNGKALYSDMWDHKPPAVHVTYAAAELVTGYGRRSIFLLTVTATLATMVGCYFAGSAFGAGHLGGLTAAAIWAIISGDLFLEGNQPNTEIFLNFCLTGAFALIVSAKSFDLERWRVITVGILFLLASLYKHIAIVPAFAVTIAYVISAPATVRKQAVANVARIAAVGAIGWIAVLGYFAIQGREDSFIDAIFTYNQFYAGSLWHNLASSLRIPPLPAHALILGLGLGLVVLIGLAFGLYSGPRRPWLLLLGALLGTHVAVLLPGQFFAHYYQLWLPPLIIGAGWTLALLRRALPAPIPWPAYAASAITIIGCGAFQVPQYRLPADEWSIRKYDRIFVETDRAAATLNKLLKPNERFYEWGSETGLYLATGKEPPSGIIFCEPLMLGPLKTELLQRLEADLEKEKPDLMILEEQTVRRQPLHPFIAWMKGNYRFIHSESRFWFLARKGSDLEREAVGRITRLK
jgi:hypothetical protein